MQLFRNLCVDISGRAVINAAENGSSFPLKRRDQMLDYILTLMGRDDSESFSDSSLELLGTQVSNTFGVIVFVLPEKPWKRSKFWKNTIF